MIKFRLIGHYENYGTENAYDKNSEVYAITDEFVCKEEYKSIPKEKKVALMIEPRDFLPVGYEYLEKNYDEFKYVFTYDDKLLKELPNALPIVYATYWCTSDLPKTKGISMVSSNKNFCEGHIKRLEIANILDKTDKVDVMGTWNGGRYIDPIEALGEYKFSVAMENDLEDLFFTEKICNCFANKVVPIYYGARKIGDFFDKSGIIYIEDRDKIPEIIQNLDIDKEYAKRKKAIDKNYEIVKQYRSFDDWFYKKYEKEIAEMFK